MYYKLYIIYFPLLHYPNMDVQGCPLMTKSEFTLPWVTEFEKYVCSWWDIHHARSVTGSKLHLHVITEPPGMCITWRKLVVLYLFLFIQTFSEIENIHQDMLYPMKMPKIHSTNVYIVLLNIVFWSIQYPFPK